MTRAVVLSAVRTPVGRHGGALAGVRPDDLAAVAIAAAVERAGIDPGEVEDVYLGCANQAGEDNRNVARMAALLAGLPQSVPGVTVNRLCASGLSAVVSACHAVVAGDGDLFVAGGVESMSPCSAGAPETRPALRPREPDRVGHDAGLAFPEPAARGDVPARVDGRDRRERRRALGCLTGRPGRLRPQSQRRWRGGGRLRTGARRRRGPRAGRASTPGHDTGQARRC